MLPFSSPSFLMRTAHATLLALAVTALATQAQAQDVRIDANGIRTGTTTIDANGIHTSTASISSNGTITTHASSTVATSGSGGDVGVVDNNRHGIYDCAGGAASIAGNNNDLVLKDCSSVSIPGNNNHLTVSLRGQASVSVSGNHNAVHYTRVAGARSASVSDVGNHNAVTGN